MKPIYFLYSTQLKLRFLAPIIGILLISFSTFALEADKKEPLHISADRVFFNRQTGVNLYEGKVKLIQGTSELTAATMLVMLDTQGQLKKIIAKGSPARYRTLFDKTKPEVIATAKSMEYYPQEDFLALIDEATVIEGGNSFEGSRIEYNIRKRIVTSATARQGQIHIVLQPQENRQK